MVSQISETNMRLVREELGGEVADQIEDAMRRQQEHEETSTEEQRATALRMAYLRLQAGNEFQSGELVDWKQGLKPTRVDGPFVFDRYIEAFNDDCDYPIERTYDCVIGVIDGCGDMALLYTDSRRLCHWYRPDPPQGRRSHNP